jgi:hypothetical protein
MLAGSTQRYLNPGFRERIGNSRRTGHPETMSLATLIFASTISRG